MKNKIFTKLDRRHNGFHYWKYYVNRPNTDYGKMLTLYGSQSIFFQWREWCWAQWGPSKELDDWLEDLRNPHLADQYISHNEHWCFQHNQYSTRIYLRDDKELSTFLLKWAI